ncbi:MAG: protein kinase domain-containing protein, partial [Candidatus Xenobia bacterium]
ALKESSFDFLPHSERGKVVAQFHREARLLSSLTHGNLVDVKDAFEENGRHYLVMDYVSGSTLEEHLAHQTEPLDWQQVCEWGDQLCDVLGYLHSRRPPIIFRDLKPGNVMLDPDGTLRLIDFGIARVLEPESIDLSEREGTIGYAPYEQHVGQMPDARTDIYALGATLYHLLTGMTPPSAVALSQGKARLVKVCNRNPDVPAAFESLVLKMMEMSPHQRFDNVGQAREALRTAYKNARQTTVRRVSLDDEGPRRLAPLVEKTVPVVAYTPPPKTQEVSAPPPPAPAPVAPAPPPAEKPKSGGLLGFLKRGPGLGKAWLIDSEGKPSEIRITGYKDGAITFISSSVQNTNLPLTLFFAMKNSKDAPVEVEVTLVKRQMVGDKLEYHARSPRFPAELGRLLAQTFPASEEQLAEEGRRAPRQRSSFQVTSRDLPGYKALASNLSTTGIQLLVREEIPVDTVLTLALDFDDFRLQNINCQGRIMWCRPQAREFAVGVQFVDLPASAAETVHQYLGIVSGPKGVRM